MTIELQSQSMDSQYVCNEHEEHIVTRELWNASCELSSSAIICTTCQIFPLFQCGCSYSIVCQVRGFRDTTSWARGKEPARFGRFWWFDFACCSWIFTWLGFKRWVLISYWTATDRCSPRTEIRMCERFEGFHSHLQICLCGLACFSPLWWASYLNVTGSAIEHWNFKSWHLNWSVCVCGGINAIVIVFTVVVVFKSIMNDTLTRHWHLEHISVSVWL